MVEVLLEIFDRETGELYSVTDRGLFIERLYYNSKTGEYKVIRETNNTVMEKIRKQMVKEHEMRN